MAIREELVLDLSQALSQLDDLERSLDSLLQPVTIPLDVDVDIDGVDKAEDEFEELRREVDKTDDGLERVERQANDTGDDLARAGKKGKSAFSGLTKGVLAFGAALGGIAALRAVGGFFADSINAASDLEESVGKATVVFGEFFGDIEEFTSTAPQALGLSNAAALEMTGTFGNLFVALGLSQQAAADLAPDIVQLGADLASFNNLEVTDALDKLRAGLVGEAEPLRALGVNLTAATTTAKAMELGLVDVNGVVTEAGKVQARYALILEQTATAQGDFARTSDGIANQQRTLAGEFENLKATVGAALVPAFQAILDLAPAVIVAIETGLVPAVQSFSAAIASVDTDALALALGQLPAIIGGTVSQISAPIATLVKFAQAFNALTALEFGDFFDDMGDAFASFNNIAAKGTATKAITNLIVTLGKGATPAEAFEAVLVDLGKSVDNLDLEQFEGLVDQLLSIADLDDVDIVNQIALIKKFGPAAGFSAAGVDILINSLLEARSAAGTLPPPMDELARGAERAGRAATEGAEGVDDFAKAMAELSQARIDETIQALEDQFTRLPDALDAAAAALRDSENEIVEDFTIFLDNLDAELEARAEFATNIAILMALGLDDLAAVFELAGLNAARALADAVANPDEARKAERKLEGFAEAQAAAFNTAFLGELSRLIPPGGLTIPASIVVALEGVTLSGDLPTIPNLIIPGTGEPAGDV